MLGWIFLLSIASFIIGYIVNTFFVYIPIARIEKTIDRAASNVDKVSSDLDRVGRNVEHFLSVTEPQIFAKLDMIIQRLSALENCCSNQNQNPNNNQNNQTNNCRNCRNRW